LTAPDEVKIARFAARNTSNEQAREAAAADARVRMRHQIPDPEKVARADYVLENTGDLNGLRSQVIALWQRLKEESNIILRDESLK
jgi:dephospho-CoA kinase